MSGVLDFEVVAGEESATTRLLEQLRIGGFEIPDPVELERRRREYRDTILRLMRAGSGGVRLCGMSSLPSPWWVHSAVLWTHENLLPSSRPFFSADHLRECVWWGEWLLRAMACSTVDETGRVTPMPLAMAATVIPPPSWRLYDGVVWPWIGLEPEKPKRRRKARRS